MMKSARPLPIDTVFKQYRQDFPIFQHSSAKPLAFLDSAASAQKPLSVLKQTQDFYASSYANIHRGVYDLSAKATEAFEAARQKVQHFLKAASIAEIIFTSGATEAINLVAYTYGDAFLKAGDEVIVSLLEHHSNIVPWQLLQTRKNIVIKVAPMLPDGSFDLEGFRKLLTPRTKMVAVAHVSNTIGTVFPIREIARLAHQAGAVVLVDGCQATPHLSINVQELDSDFYIFTGHKLYGPTGIGILYGKKQLLEKMPPFLGGGHMINTVSFEKTTFASPPARFEAGTSNIAGAIGLGYAIDYVQKIGLDEIHQYEKILLDYLLQQLKTIAGLRVIGHPQDLSPVVSFVMDSAHPHDIATILDQYGVAVRAGHHCAQPAMQWFGVTGTTRVSLGLYNSIADIDQLMTGLRQVKKVFG